MRFLRKSDYYRLIQPNDLNTILSTATQAGYDADQLLIDTENGAIELIKSYLSARYDLDRIFTDTPVYASGTTYYAQKRVQYHETAYSASATYVTGNRVSYNGSIYSSIAGNTAEAFNPAHWTFVCLDYALFYAILPAGSTEFQELTNYPAGSVVWYKDNRTYTALRNTTGQLLNNAVYSEYGADRTNDPNAPIIKDDLTNTAYWQQNAVYSFSNQLPTNGTYWAQGDNRSQLIVEHVIDITLFNLFSTISPRNIPELRLIRFDGNDRNQNGGAIGWLKKVADGEISAILPNKTPIQGLATIFNSGAPKSSNFY